MKIFFGLFFTFFILNFVQAEVIRPRFKRISDYRYAPSVSTVIDGSTSDKNANENVVNSTVSLENNDETTANPNDTTDTGSTVTQPETTTIAENFTPKSTQKHGTKTKKIVSKFGRKHSGIVGSGQDSTLHDGEVSSTRNSLHSSVTNLSEVKNDNNVHDSIASTKTSTDNSTNDSLIFDANATLNHTTKAIPVNKKVAPPTVINTNV